ncbi:unnamed protein product, partial [Prorocentrum cordatum]
AEMDLEERSPTDLDEENGNPTLPDLFKLCSGTHRAFSNVLKDAKEAKPMAQ